MTTAKAKPSLELQETEKDMTEKLVKTETGVGLNELAYMLSGDLSLSAAPRPSTAENSPAGFSIAFRCR